jgi:plastocyanin
MKIKISGILLGIFAVITITCVLGSGLIACTSSSSTSTTTTSTSATSTTPTTSPAGEPVPINLVAQNMAFNLSTITVPAGAKVTINFDNKDSGIPHNFSLYKDSTATPPALFQGQIIRGPATATYTFTAPTTPGNYFFRCDIHPTIMTGTFIVQ